MRQSIDPMVHYGRIASGNPAIKDAHTGDRLSRELSNICFEIEAVSFMDKYTCLVVRGICDCSDSQENK
jgi:hypothetical protein